MTRERFSPQLATPSRSFLSAIINISGTTCTLPTLTAAVLDLAVVSLRVDGKGTFGAFLFVGAAAVNEGKAAADPTDIKLQDSRRVPLRKNGKLRATPLLSFLADRLKSASVGDSTESEMPETPMTSSDTQHRFWFCWAGSSQQLV